MRLCECGCGRPTTLILKSNARHGWVRGEYHRFVHGHQVGRGSSHMNWVGGRSENKGYISVLQPDGSHQLEHIIVAQRALGRPLPKGAPVHHVNGNRADNRPANLVICQDSAYHNVLHRRQRAFNATGNPNAYPCVYCGGWQDQDGMTKLLRTNGSIRAYHKPCNTEAAREYRRQRSA